MKINFKLLPMKLHYMAFFAGTAPILPFLPVFMNENLHLSYKGISIIYTLLPFFGLVAKALSGALADFFKAHKIIFLISIALCGLGYSSVYFAPEFPTKENPNPAKLHFECLPRTSYLRYVIPLTQCGDKLNKKLVATCKVNCETTPENSTAICKNWNVSTSCETKLLQFSTFSFLKHTINDGKDVFFLINNITYEGEEIYNPQCSKSYRLKCKAFCDNEQLMSYLGASTRVPISDYNSIVSNKSFAILLTFVVIGGSSLAICCVMSDTICFKLLGDEPNKYGRQRLFGSIGWGASVILTGFLIDILSPVGALEKSFTAAFVLCIGLITIDFIIATRIPIERNIRDKVDFRVLCSLVIKPRILLFILCCFIVGMSTGMLWTYQLILVEKAVYMWDCHFHYIKLLGGLIVGVGCFGGELPFFFVSNYFIEKMGHAHAMSLCIFAFGLRFMLYSVVTNPWYFLPIELLSGFTFGIFYTVMTTYAKIVAPEGNLATVQGVVGATFEGAGVASGSLLGGVLFSTAGEFRAFFIFGLMDMLFAALHLSIQILLDRYKPERHPIDPSYVRPSDNIEGAVNYYNNLNGNVHNEGNI